MQLVNGTLRCLRVLRSKLNVQLVVNNNVQVGANGFNSHFNQHRSYASASAVAISTEQFDGPTTDPSRSPLVTFHGLFGSKQNWRSISKSLAAKTNRRIYTADLRNHGDSPHASTHDSFGMTADIHAFMQSNSIPKICAMGHSMGGRAVMHFALSYPQLVERLIVVDISPTSMPGSLDYLRGVLKGMMAVSLPASLSLSEGRKQTRKTLLDIAGADSVDFILLNLRKKPQTGEFYWACNVQVLHDTLSGFNNYGDHIAGLAPFTAPTTFICGRRSSYMKQEDWPAVQRLFPNSTLEWLDTGHLVHLEKPHQFLEITTKFLS